MSHRLTMSGSTRRLARPTSLTRRTALTALLLPLAACGDGSASGPAEAEGADTAPAAGPPHAGSALDLRDPWTKAADEGMTSSFGVLDNGTGTDLVLVGARSEACEAIQLHETAADGSGGMSMQEKEGGFPLPAGQQLVFEPGGNHLMLMGLLTPLRPGDEVELVLEFEDGTELTITAPVKDFAGAQEDYAPEGSTGSGASDGGGDHGHDQHEQDGDR